MCYHEGELMAYLDGELPFAQASGLEEHLNQCPQCRARLEELAGEAAALNQALGAYRGALDALPVSTAAGRKTLAGRLGQEARQEDNLSRYPQPPLSSLGMSGEGSDPILRGEGLKMKTYRKFLSWAAAAVVVVGVFAFTPAKSIAAQFLSIFRVDRVEVLHFDPQDMEDLRLALEGSGHLDLDNFGQVEVELQGEYREVSPEEAAAEAGFEVMLPRTLGDYRLAPAVSLERGEQVTITPDVNGINDLLQDLGSETLLPQELDGQTFIIDVPQVVKAAYSRDGSSYDFSLVQAPSPTMTAPDGVDVAAIRDALLAVPVLPPAFKNALEGIDNWQNTLVVPDFNGEAREVTVNGTQGVFVNTHGDYGFLAWPRDGVWMALEGRLTLDQALTLAEELD